MRGVVADVLEIAEALGELLALPDLSYEVLQDVGRGHEVLRRGGEHVEEARVPGPESEGQALLRNVGGRSPAGIWAGRRKHRSGAGAGSKRCTPDTAKTPRTRRAPVV